MLLSINLFKQSYNKRIESNTAKLPINIFDKTNKYRNCLRIGEIWTYNLHLIRYYVL